MSGRSGGESSVMMRQLSDRFALSDLRRAACEYDEDLDTFSIGGGGDAAAASDVDMDSLASAASRSHAGSELLDELPSASSSRLRTREHLSSSASTSAEQSFFSSSAAASADSSEQVATLRPGTDLNVSVNRIL